MISILMPVFNGIEFINDSVSSILDQTYTGWELIIGINGHAANSLVFLAAKEYEQLSRNIRVIDLPHIRGKANALNAMVPHCKYDYVALLDVDDIWYEQKLELQSYRLHDYDVIGTQCIYFGDRAGTIPAIPMGDISNYDFSIVNPIINSSVIVRKEYCHWHDGIEGVEDYDMWLRLRKLNLRFFNVDTVLVGHRIHSQSAFNAKGNASKVAAVLETNR